VEVGVGICWTTPLKVIIWVDLTSIISFLWENTATIRIPQLRGFDPVRTSETYMSMLSTHEFCSSTLSRVMLYYCGRDKGMPNGWSFNWESMTTRERESPGTCCVESLHVVYMSCVSFCHRCQKTVPLPIRGWQQTGPRHKHGVRGSYKVSLSPPRRSLKIHHFP
jgi:hypothetical protein